MSVYEYDEGYDGRCQYCLDWPQECDCKPNRIQGGKFYKNSYWPIRENDPR